MSAKIAVITWSLYGHVAELANDAIEGAKAAGAEVKQFQPDDLKEFDGFILAFPTRYGRAPAQVSAFFDQTGGLWATGALVGKFGSVITSTASQHGGLETTALTTIPWFVHHGINFVPIGYQFPELQEVQKIQGSSAYGAGSVTSGDGSLRPTEQDKTVAKGQGKHFANVVGQFVRGKQ
ncbi:hypothetical protein L7F22_010062 [Adiantum nelumboides]|nr:hypothetical protein [Adiantum nelumboides]